MMRRGVCRGIRSVGFVLVCLGVIAPTGAQGQTQGQAAARALLAPLPAQAAPEAPYPRLSTRREVVLTGLGAGLMVTGLLLDGQEQLVPAGGLDPAEIAWGVDRQVVGNRSLDADAASDWTRNAAIVFPAVLAVVLAEPGHRFDRAGARALVYTETFLFSMGSTLAGKVGWSRARPYTYMPEGERPDDPHFDVSQERAFRSMPSGHSSSAWTGVGIGMTEQLLTRPDAHWAERVAVGFVCGALGGSTSALRVEGGQHFPSDVIAGAGLGLGTGIAIPLLHRSSRPLPPVSAWLQMFGGALAGTLVGVAVAL